MKFPLEIVFRDVPRSASIESLVREQADRLHRFADDIISCRVAIEKPHRHQRVGHAFRVRVEIKLPPNKDLVVAKEPGELELKLPAVVHAAFDAMERQLKKANAERRGDVKAHPDEALALVVRLFDEDGYGFLKTVETGEEVYFHRNSVLNDEWDRLEIGTMVRFAPEMGDEGLQASSLLIVDKPGIARSGTGMPEPYVPAGWKP